MPAFPYSFVSSFKFTALQWAQTFPWNFAWIVTISIVRYNVYFLILSVAPVAPPQLIRIQGEDTTDDDLFSVTHNEREKSGVKDGWIDKERKISK